ncbi:hypothetical protein BGZ76_007505 [Entomortierella beljakovae]|nr:hypothetical protein BGZ76_007505 [Entomortierella beljakovae]
MTSNLAPMQVFEFQADSSVSLVSTAAINRRSCDHCFLNRKTCDKVRQAADSGDKCKRCAKDNRPCTFTPTVHLYHIADCVGRHQCRAKVIQAMGGIKNTVQFKTIEIPIVCDMDNESDRALFEYIQKNPNLLVYNNRIKSFLAQDMLGINPDHDPISASYAQGISNYSAYPRTPSPSAVYGNSNSSMTSPIHGPTRYGTSPVDPNQQQHYVSQRGRRDHPYNNHSKSNSEDRGRHSPIRPSHSPRLNHSQSYNGNGSRHPSLTSADPITYGGQLSPSSSPINLSPLDPNGTLNYDHHDGFATITSSSGIHLAGAYQQHMQQSLQQPVPSHPYNPYAQQTPYPQALFFPQAQQQQQQQMNNCRGSSPFGTSPTQQYSPQPPSPINTGFVLGNNNSQQNLVSLFDNTLNMGTGMQTHSLHRRQHSSSSISASDIASPSTSNNQAGSDGSSPDPNTPLVITTLNAEGQASGLYHTIPVVNLNPGANEADLFHDFTVMDDTPVGESFVWVKNLFDDAAAAAAAAGVAADDDQGSSNATSTAIPIGSAGVNNNNLASSNSEQMVMEGFLRRQQQHDEWSSQYNPQDSLQG